MSSPVGGHDERSLPMPYPDEPTWWTDTLAEIGALYEQVGQTFNLGMFKWGTRIAYDIANGMTKEGSKAKHLRELKRELGIIDAPPATQAWVDVQLVGRSWEHAGGSFRPVGTTLMWALGGLHRGERDRVGQNFAWIHQAGLGYYRLLAQGDWKGEEIDPFHADYFHELGDLLDFAYDDYGLMAHVTVIGGKKHGDAARIASIVRDVVSTRRHTVLMLESVNEDQGSEEEAVEIAKILAPLELPFGVGLGDQGIGVIEACSKECHATLAYYHTSRTNGDNGARQVRQCWDFKEFGRASADSEPPGIASSGAEFTDPFKMAAKRAADIICGAGVFCLHTGSGVFGRAMLTATGLQRQANLWEVPGIDEMAAAVRMADTHLPAGIEGWTKFNVNQPIKVLAGSVNKLYGSRQGNRFAEIAIGCESPTLTLVAKDACDLQVVNPATGDLQQFELNTDQTCQVSGLWAYVLVGTLR